MSLHFNLQSLESAQMDLDGHMEGIRRQVDKKFQCLETEFHKNINNTFVQLCSMDNTTGKVLAERLQVKFHSSDVALMLFCGYSAMFPAIQWGRID